MQGARSCVGRVPAAAPIVIEGLPWEVVAGLVVAGWVVGWLVAWAVTAPRG